VPQLQVNKMIGALSFSAKGLKLPTNFELEPQWIKNKYVASLPPEQRVAVPKLIPQWFKPQLPVGPHQVGCDSIGQGWKDFHDTILDAVVYGHNMWRMQAKFGPMAIAGPVVAGTPGCLSGPPLEGLIKQYPACASMTPAQTPYRDAVAGGVGKAFTLWQSTVTVPGLPLFPGYVMQPPGSAIPMPNIPQTLIACVSVNTVLLVVPASLKELMLAVFKLGGRTPNDVDHAIFEAISTVLGLAFITWMSNQMVLNVVGSGAVASPMGGPVAGVTLPTPGHLAT
jgi:hypothetical protein